MTFLRLIGNPDGPHSSTGTAAPLTSTVRRTDVCTGCTWEAGVYPGGGTLYIPRWWYPCIYPGGIGTSLTYPGWYIGTSLTYPGGIDLLPSHNPGGIDLLPAHNPGVGRYTFSHTRVLVGTPSPIPGWYMCTSLLYPGGICAPRYCTRVLFPFSATRVLFFRPLGECGLSAPVLWENVGFLLPFFGRFITVLSRK